MSTASLLNNCSMSYGEALRHPITAKRALKVALVVGTILVAINQGDVLLHGHLPPIWKIILTYMVPYSVSSYSSAAFIVELSRSVNNNAEQAEEA